jgi:2-phosphosulfolactate phosphatase
MPTLNVHFLPSQVAETKLAGSTVVVIDVLRATSTICQALANGAQGVMPFLEVDETRQAAERFSRSEIVLGGERHGRRIEGFDLGNSPLEYTPGVVAGKRVLFTTTNGTRAMHHARHAQRTLMGCLLNRAALVEALVDEPRVDILCAATDGVETGEDVLAAGAIVYSLVEADRPSSMSTVLNYRIDEGAHRALTVWHEALDEARDAGRSVETQLERLMRDTPGGRNLLEIGNDADIAACARLDALDVVPELDRQLNEIRPA